MIAYHDLKGLLEIIITWENKLTDFYDRAATIIEDNNCGKIIELLKENHKKNLQIIKDINIADYGKDEWIQLAPDYNIELLLPEQNLSDKLTPKEIIDTILEFEEKMKNFYASITEKIVSKNEKDLFESMVAFKERQIIEIKDIVETYYLYEFNKDNNSDNKNTQCPL